MHDTEPDDNLAEGTDIAIVGMAGRFPGASGVRQLWRNIGDGRSGITRFSEEELRAAGVSEELLRDPDYVRAGAVLEGIEDFDAEFFGINATEARILDPQHRLFLEHCWEALEDAGCDPARTDGAVGVVAGCALSSYFVNNLAHSDMIATLGELAVGLGNDKDSLTTRVAHALGLDGPNYAVQSYCSTSLVAVCVAASSLAAFESDVMLAGGVAVSVPQRVGYVYQPGGISPPDGECRAFDAAGLGAPLGSGVGVVALRRLEDARADGDRVYAVIRGWATNNDAGRKVGFTAPGVQGQATVIDEALSSCGLTPGEIDYVEAHGTGTALGDAVELSAIQQVFDGASVRIGSVKTNVGHLDRAAGVTNLIKASLALHDEEIPPTRNLSEPNPQLAAGGADITVVTERTPWPRRPDRPRRAGVSAFGIGGTNAHVVLEEAPRPAEATEPAERVELLVWSARTATAADEAGGRLAEHLEGAGAAERLADVAHTLQTGRQVFEHRRMAVVEPGADPATVLREQGPMSWTESRSDRQVGFLIAGVGEHYPGMAEDLYRSEPVFAGALEECREILAEHLEGNDPLADMLRPRDPVSATGSALSWLLDREGDTGPAEHNATDRVQPAVFAVQYALARLLFSWGVRPTVMAGYSIGEYVAACLSGVLSLPDALAMVAHRATLISGMPAGAMAAVPLPAAELHRRIDAAGIAGVDTAAVNGPELTVISGPPDALGAVRATLTADAVPCRPLATSHAFHSRMLEPVADELTEWVRRTITPRAPEIPYLSNVTGEPVTAAQVLDPRYWADHMCAPVQFEAMLGQLLADEDMALLELGPGQSLGALVRGRPNFAPQRWPLVIPTLPGANDPRRAGVTVPEGVGRLWLTGVPVDWTGYRGDRQVRKVGLPTYPFQRQRYWVDPPAATPATRRTEVVAEEPDREIGLLTARWTPRAPGEPDVELGRCLLLADEDDRATADAVAAELDRAGAEVVVVPDGPGTGHAGDGPVTVVDLRSLRHTGPDGATGAVTAAAGVLAEWGERSSGTTRVVLVTRGGQAVADQERPDAAHAAVAAMALVGGQEYVNLDCRAVDTDPAGDPAATAGAVRAELGHPPDEVVVAYRAGRRFVCEYLAEPTSTRVSTIRPGGTYLITGGLGGIGLALAEHVAEAGAGRLVLTGRAGLPADETDRRNTVVRRLRARGVQVSTPRVDVVDEAGMRALFAGETGRIDGVVHAAASTGLDGFRALRETDPAVVEEHFRAKLDGAAVLHRLIEELPAGRTPEFCALFSSTAAILGGLTFGAYSAANAALAAFGRRHAARWEAGETPTRWITGCWDPWASTMGALGDGASIGAELLRLAMSDEEALRAFDTLLAGTQACRVVTAAGVADRLPRAGAAQAPSSAGRHDRFPRPELAHPYTAPRTAGERAVAELWSEVLGVHPVGVTDGFFDLGGNSLLSLQMVSLVKKRLGVAVPSTVLLEVPTVEGFADRLDLPDEPVTEQAADAGEETTHAANTVLSGGTGATVDAVRTYLPSWSPRPLPLTGLDAQLRAAGPWLVFSGEARGETLVERLELAGAEVVVVRPGTAFGSVDGGGEFTVRTAEPDDHLALLRAQLVAPRTIVHGFSLASPTGAGSAHFDAEQERGMRSVRCLADALAERAAELAGFDMPYAELVVLTPGALGVLGPDADHPEHAALAGVVPTLAAENPRLRCRQVDLDAEPGIEQVLAASVCPDTDVAAVRSGGIWLRRFEPLVSESAERERSALGIDETVLITGGLTETGMTIARHLVGTYGCRLALATDIEFPPRETWTGLAEDHPAAARVHDIRDLEERGVAVLIVSADMTDEAAMRAMVATVTDEFGEIDVVVHAGEADEPAEPGNDAVLRARVHSFQVLQSALGEHCAGHRVAMPATHFGPGAAADAAVGAYASAARRCGRGSWVSVEPAPWHANGRTDRERGDLSPQETVQVFERALAARHVPHLVVASAAMERSER